MAVYRNISMDFWTDGKVVDDFTPEDKYFYIYVLTNPHTNLCGCYEVSMRQMATETGYNADSILRLIDRFHNVHRVLEYNKDTKEMLIYNWCKYNWTTSNKLDKPLMRDITAIKSKRFRDYVSKLYAQRDAREPYTCGIDTVSIPYGYPMDTTVSVSVSVSDTVTVTDKGECEGKKQPELPKEPETLSKPPKAQKEVFPFDEFWAVYPKKKAKQDAIKAWDKLKPDNAMGRAIIKAVQAQKLTQDWQKNGGAYIPYPATYLNGRRWEDEEGSDNSGSTENNLAENQWAGHVL